MNVNDEVYFELRKQIDKMPIGMPATKSGVEIRILKHLFTPKEAQIAVNLNIILEPLTKIYIRVKKAGIDISIEQLKKILDTMAMKGCILFDTKGGKRLYRMAQLAIGMFEFQVDRMTKEFYEDCEEYLMEHFGHELNRTKIPQMKPVPINKSITPEHSIALYDNIREIIKNTEGQYGVMNCICKQGQDLIGKHCQVTDFRDTCITFPSASSLFIQFGSARPISKDEALMFVNRAEDAGLVIQPMNTQKPGAICCCCGDCCGILKAAKQYSHPAELFTTNYYAEVNPELCSGCGICVKRCQMEAVAVTDIEKIPTVDLNRCIGCGLCVPTCKKSAITLKKKTKEIKPPKNTHALYRKILIKKLGPLGILKTGLRIALGQRF